MTSVTETYDIVLIGGGIAGISLAARLAEVARVVVLEREEAIGYHSTGRSAAMFIRNYGNATLRKLNAASEPELAEPDGISEHSLLSPRGELIIASEDDLPAFEDYMRGAERIEELSPHDATGMIPILREDRIVRAALEREARDIDVDRLVQGLVRQLGARGGKIVKQADVVNISRKDRIWHIGTTKAGAFQAPIVVNAAGAWADQIARIAGVPLIGLTPMRRSAAILPALDGFDVSDWPLVAPVSESWYAKPEGGKLLVSPADEDPVEPHDAWPDDMVLAEGLHRFEQSVTIKITRIEHSWAGLRSFVADRTPVVGYDAEHPGFFWLAGQGGYGVQTSPALSRLSADLILDRSSVFSPDVITALSPTRVNLARQRPAHTR